MIQSAEELQIPGALISVDFQKYFDTISFKGIYGALQFFGIGNSFIDMVRTTYTDFTAVV